MPEYPERLLSDNIPCLRKDRKEDGAFAGCLSFLIFLFQCFAAGRDVPEQVRPFFAAFWGRRGPACFLEVSEFRETGRDGARTLLRRR